MYWILFIGNILVVAGHILWSSKIGFFNLDKEMNLASAWTGLQLLGAGFVFGLYGYLRNLRLWQILSLGFLFLGFDEIMFFHERIGFFLNKYLSLTGYYGESFNWLIYFSPFIIVAILVLFRISQNLFRQGSRYFKFFISGVILFIISLSLELIGAKILLTENFDPGHGIYFRVLIFEEFSEMLGSSMFLIAGLKLVKNILAVDK